MTSSPHGPYGQGFTRNTMVGTEGPEVVSLSARGTITTVGFMTGVKS